MPQTQLKRDSARPSLGGTIPEGVPGQRSTRRRFEVGGLWPGRANKTDFFGVTMEICWRVLRALDVVGYCEEKNRGSTRKAPSRQDFLDDGCADGAGIRAARRNRACQP